MDWGRCIAVCAIGGVSLLAAAGPASAGLQFDPDEPQCSEAIHSRPGLDRTVKLSCWNFTRIRVVESPAHARVHDLTSDGFGLRFGLATDADAPEDDRLVVELVGDAGTVHRTVQIVNVPANRNTAPTCERVEMARRSDGLGPAQLEFVLNCHDAESDHFTIHGAGPGVHLDAPRLVKPAENTSVWWRYRTAVPAGPEMTSVYAVDSQGARSADAPMSFVVGPQVDRPTACSSWSGHARPGARRDFFLGCTDPDGDDIGARLGRAPGHGGVESISSHTDWHTWAESGGVVRGTYVPDPGSSASDSFTIVPLGSGRPGTPAEVTITTRPLPENGALECAEGRKILVPASGWTPVPLGCADAEGDPLTARIIEQPRHVRLDEPATDSANPGSFTVGITSSTAFSGEDRFTVRIEDPFGARRDVTYRVASRNDAPWTAGPDGEGWFWSPSGWMQRPHSGRDPTAAPGQVAAETAAAQARRVLRTKAVRMVRRMGSAQLFAPTATLRSGPSVRALAVVCAVRCTATARRGLTVARASAGTLKAAPGKPALVRLRLSSAERRRVARTRKARARFAVRTVPVTGAARTARVTLTVRPRP